MTNQIEGRILDQLDRLRDDVGCLRQRLADLEHRMLQQLDARHREERVLNALEREIQELQNERLAEHFRVLEALLEKKRRGEECE